MRSFIKYNPDIVGFVIGVIVIVVFFVAALHSGDSSAAINILR